MFILIISSFPCEICYEIVIVSIFLNDISWVYKELGVDILVVTWKCYSIKGDYFNALNAYIASIFYVMIIIFTQQNIVLIIFISFPFNFKLTVLLIYL